MATRFIFEDTEIYDLRSIRDKMRDIMDDPKPSSRKKRARAFAEAYRAVDENADGNIGQAAGYLGSRFTEALALFGGGHPVFGDEDPRDAGERLHREDDAINEKRMPK